MAKKRKMLPKDFDKLLKAGDLDALKVVFEKCELNAHGFYASALHYYNAPADFVRWYVQQGGDIEAKDMYERTPLYAQSGMWDGQVELLLELGANIHATDKYDKDTPLHNAAFRYIAKNVEILLRHGADATAKNAQGLTPLENALRYCRNADISNMAAVATLLIARTPASPKAQEYVKAIGEEFEFHRENFAEEYLAETDAGLARLYELFDVPPVPSRLAHDGVSNIVPGGGTWQEQYAALWDLLIPSSGAAKTVQGEAVRIPGRVADELYRNGGANWDRDFRKMLDALNAYLAMGTPLPDAELEEAARLSKSIGADSDEGTDRLKQLAVQWVLLNPEPIALEKPMYRR